MKFSGELTAAIAFHHYPDLDVDYREMVQVVYFADALSHLLPMGDFDPEFVASLEAEGWIPFDLSTQDIGEIYSRLQKEIGESEAFLGIHL